ncbi:MAG TPA: amidohydrolase family protein, partial [Bdellovibrionales bacterium]|nr:amidohydrolase family protein [Bdellovibrionales bacterium]
LECSAILIGDLDESGEETVQEHMVKPIKWVFDYVEDPKKLMFGTDWPLVGIKDYLEAYKKAIPPEHWRAVFHDNAKRVFFKEMPIPSAPVARAPASRE